MDARLSLDQIGRKYGTDKASGKHAYLDFYQPLLESVRDRPLKVLEIGILDGASLRMWEEYFPAATVVGADINPATKRFERGRVIVELLDQSNVESLTRLAMRHGPFDLVIEDGSHLWEHQRTTLRTLFPFLRSDGIYILEDLHTNYGSLVTSYRGVATHTCVAMLKDWLDLCVADAELPLAEVEDPFLRTYGRAVDYISFHRRTCAIKKRMADEIGPQPRSFGDPLFAVASDAVAMPLVAHVAHRGDVYNPAGFVTSTQDQHAIQRFLIESELVAYRGRWEDGTWTDWGTAGGWIGRFAKGRPLTGFSIRLTPEAAASHGLRVAARFVGSQTTTMLEGGGDCVSDGGALLSLQVQVAPV